MCDVQLDKLLRPESIAVVGASERPDAIGTRVIRNLRQLGFGGRIYAVNPRYNQIEGIDCFPSLSALPERVDAAFFAVPAAQGPALMEQAAAAGVRAVFMNANGFADGDAAGLDLQKRISDIAKAHGIAVCGPNNIGLINVFDKVAAWTPRYMKRPKEGPIALISQSGSIAIALADNEREIGFSYLITAGNEAVLSIADYLRHCVHDDRVRVILLCLETIRNVDGLFSAAVKALEQKKPIIALKLGRSEKGCALVRAHTGSLAGDDRLFDEFSRKLGIIRVSDLDEMLETALILSIESRPSPRRGLVVVTLSGGEAALIADTTSELGANLAPLSATTIERMRSAFPPYATIRNPIDAWGLGFNVERFAVIVNALVADPEIGTIAVSVDAPRSGGADVPYACAMAKVCVTAATASEKHFIFFNNMSGAGPNEEVRSILEGGDIPYLSGMRAALAAIGHTLLEPPKNPIPNETVHPSNWADGRLPATDTARFRMLAAAGVPMTECVAVLSAEDAVRVAEHMGYPLVLKGTGPTIAHKSDLGLVRIGLHTSEDIRTAYQDVARTLAREANDHTMREIYLQKMAKHGIELIVGVRNDPNFGSFIVAGLGGVFVELLNNVAVRLAPIDIAEAHAMLMETAAGRLLAGARGQPPFDIGAVAHAIAALSRVGATMFGRLACIEINPLIVHEKGAIGVDLLIEEVKPEKLGE